MSKRGAILNPPWAAAAGGPVGLSRRNCLVSLTSLAAPAAWLGAPQVAHAGGQL